MSHTWLVTLLIATPATAFLAAAIAVHRVSRRIERERRQGLLDLTGITPRTRHVDPPAHARAHTPPEFGGRSFRIPLNGSSLSVPAFPPPPEIRTFEHRGTQDGVSVYQELSETELAARFATQQQPRGADAA